MTSRLRELGFVLEMDDFGSGYSSLNMLNQMPIDVLKLDMKFIQSETAKPLEHGILQFVIDLARRMHLSVVAEGVETREQLERLLEVDCDYVQGYYFARPMPAEEFEQFLKKEKLRGKLGGITFSNNEDRSGHYKQLLLIADEDEQYIEQVRKNFSALFHVMAAADVNTALNLVAEQGDQIALVLLSHSLSKDGTFAVLELIQRNRDLWKIPVIITGPADRDLERKALKSGAVDYAAKPHWPESLTKRVAHAIRLNTYRMREEILREEAFRDHMTGALNRRGWQAAAGTLHKGDAPMAVCFFDLDNLKKINDICGHGEGDRMIVEFSKLIRENIRDTDIVARLGGDEFIVVMKRMQSPEIALKKCQEICNAFREDPIIEKMPATASAGIVMWNTECSLEDIIEQVDTALYHAKTTHDGQCVIL